MLAKAEEFIAEKKVPAKREYTEQHHDERWKDPVDAPGIEIQECEVGSFDIANHNSGDEISGDDEEHVYAGKTSREALDARVERNDAEDGKCSQSVDFRPIGAGTVFRIQRKVGKGDKGGRRWDNITG